jgi:hypothetical protein
MLARLKARVDLEAAAGYVLSKRGSDGGYLSYQFMDMFESSAEDTYYALYSLRLLGVEPPRAAETVEFLRRLQREDGGYSSVEVAYFSIAALGLLGASPRDPSGAAEFLERSLAASAEAAAAVFPSFEEEQLIDEKGVLKSKDATYVLTPADFTPVPVRAAMAVLALHALGRLSGEAEELARSILTASANGGVFGVPAPSLEVTCWALEALSLLGPLPEPGRVERWVLACENEDGGFSANPYSRTAYVENLYFGLRALEILGSKPRYPLSHAEYVTGLQNANGGFRRSRELGSSSLEFTYYALRSMRLLGLL